MIVTAYRDQMRTTMAEYYSLRLALLGDDADTYLALGHQPPRRMVAACAAWSRSVGYRLLDQGDELLPVLNSVRPRWAVPGHNEWCPDLHEPGGAITPEQSCGCADNGHQWWLRFIDEGTQGAFPVTELTL